MYLSKEEQKLRNAIRRRSDAYDYADGPAVQPANKTFLAAQNGNPGFVAQFDVAILLKYFTVAAGVYTSITAAALLAAQPTLATRLPAFLFGESDFTGGYARLKQQFALTIWAYDNVFIYGRGQCGTVFGNIDATVRAQLLAGDLVIPVWATLGGVNYVALTIIRCTQVGYGTLLGSLSSDMFAINMIRYQIFDTSAAGLEQFANSIMIQKQSLYGKFDSDTVTPGSYKQPDQQQAGIIDLPINKGIDKQVALATWVEYDVVNIQWSIFVSESQKLAFQ